MRLTYGFKGGLASVAVAGRWGFIDQKGKFVINPQYDGVGSFSEGYAVVETGRGSIPGCPYCSKYGFIDRKGQVVVEARFAQRPNATGGISSPVFDFSEGLAAVKTDSGWGFIDPAGKMVIDAQFDDASPFQDGLARVIVLGQGSVHYRSRRIRNRSASRDDGARGQGQGGSGCRGCGGIGHNRTGVAQPAIAPKGANVVGFSFGHGLDRQNRIYGGGADQFRAGDSIFVSVEGQYVTAGDTVRVHIRFNDATIVAVAVIAGALETGEPRARRSAVRVRTQVGRNV